MTQLMGTPAMKVRPYAVGVFALCVLSSITILARSARIAHNPAVEDDIREAVLRYQMVSWSEEFDKAVKEASNPNDKAVPDALNFMVFFISINGEDPSDAFIKRFEKSPILVKKLSQSEIDRKSLNPAIEKATGKSGVRFRVDKIKWRGSNFVEVEGGYFCGALCASGQTFNVHRTQGVWTVTGSTMRWIS